jgi:hypothetical protein
MNFRRKLTEAHEEQVKLQTQIQELHRILGNESDSKLLEMTKLLEQKVSQGVTWNSCSRNWLLSSWMRR